jgi:hypothetical protein
LKLTKPAKKYLAINCFLFCIFNPSSAQADEDTNFRVGLVNKNQVFSNAAEATSGGVIRLSVSNGRDATVKVELVDIFANSEGVKQAVPLGSTPFSPENLVSYKVLKPNYKPNGETQFIDISYSFKDAENIDRPVIGGLKISLVTSNEESGEANGFSVKSAIVATFTYFPIGSTSGDFALDALLNVQRIDVESVRPESLIYALMPDLPRLFNDGPIRANISLINNGNIFLQTRSEISVDRLKIFSGFNREELFRDNLEELLLVPGQVGSGQKLLVNEIVGSEKVADALPGIGIFQIKVKTSGTIGNDVLAELNEGVWFVIFPWKPFFLIFLVFILILVVQKQRLKNPSLAVKDYRKTNTYQQQDQWTGDILDTLIADSKKEENN